MSAQYWYEVYRGTLSARGSASRGADCRASAGAPASPRARLPLRNRLTTTEETRGGASREERPSRATPAGAASAGFARARTRPEAPRPCLARSAATRAGMRFSRRRTAAHLRSWWTKIFRCDVTARCTALAKSVSFIAASTSWVCQTVPEATVPAPSFPARSPLGVSPESPDPRDRGSFRAPAIGPFVS